MPPVQFYFDFISPFGYFASLRIDELAARYGRRVDWTSMLVSISVTKVMKVPPILETPLKGAYVVHDANRYARQHRVPFGRSGPSSMTRPLEAGRLFAWAKEVDPERAKRLAAVIYRRSFVNCQDIGEPSVLESCAADTGYNWSEYEMARELGTPAQLLRRNVDESIARGVFGSPFFIVDGEPFFGVEKLHVLEEWLARGGW